MRLVPGFLPIDRINSDGTGYVKGVRVCAIVSSAIALASILLPLEAAAEVPPSITMSIKAPADVRCIVVTVVGGRTVKRLFDVTPGQDTIVTAKGLPLGNVAVSEEAFETSCANIPSGADASWFSEPITVNLVGGTTASATVVLRQNGKMTLTSQFEGTSEVDGQGETPNKPDCRAQRLVHIIAGNGGLAWFTLLWPPFDVVDSSSDNFASDGPEHYVDARTDGAGRFLVRSIGTEPLWFNTGSEPQPTLFVAGRARAHSTNPRMMQDDRMGVEHVLQLAVGRQQTQLSAPIPVISFTANSDTLDRLTADDIIAHDIDEAINGIKAKVPLTSADEEGLRPSAAKLASLTRADSPASHLDFARKLLFAANAFRMGLVGTVQIPALNDSDPHDVFAHGEDGVTAKVDSLAWILQGFYSELQLNSERGCGKSGQPLSLSDNVAMLITGDTPKNPFVRQDWPDDPPGNTNNLVVFRSNGQLWPGWNGVMTAAGSSTFSPSLSGQWNYLANPLDSLVSVQSSILYALTHGDQRSLIGLVRSTEFPIDALTKAID